MDKDHIWLIIGFAGQALFSMRFIVQWFQSERKQRELRHHANDDSFHQR